MSTPGVREWIEYDGKNYIIDDTNTVYELIPASEEISKDILEAISEDTQTISNDSSDISIITDSSKDTNNVVNPVSKSGKRWSNEDVEVLKQLFSNGNTISQISEVLDRTNGGIFSKLQSLELIHKMERLESYEKREQKKLPIPLPKLTKVTEQKENKPIEEFKKTLAPLTDKQQEAFELFLSGKSFCLTGPGGTGKSHIIKHIVESCKGSKISCAITAMTGVAASLISGQTLHKWSGLGLMDRRIETMVGIIRNNEQVLDRWLSTQVLVIDEVSMMNQEMFEMLHVVFCKIRGNKEFYGGIQVIFCCDFAQLAPINGNYAFESPLWQKELASNTVYLNQILRQDNPEFIKMLCDIRLGLVTEGSRLALNSRLNKKADGPIQPTILYPHRKTVEETNNRKLDELKYEKRLFTAKDTKYEFSSKTTKNATAKDTETLEERSPKKIILCEQAQVMLSVNIDTEKGLVNGSRGIITGFTSGNPDVQFDNGKRITITPNTFECQTQTCIIRRVQIPLVLAWATTIHKCQGSTLTHAITDLRDAFCNAQAYVTLSRLKSLDGLYLIGIDYNKIKCDARVKTYYDCLSRNIPYTNTKNCVHILENYLDDINSECFLSDSD
jgi:ATP-dependent DNA helicase PIF1